MKKFLFKSFNIFHITITTLFILFFDNIRPYYMVKFSKIVSNVSFIFVNYKEYIFNKYKKLNEIINQNDSLLKQNKLMKSEIINLKNKDVIYNEIKGIISILDLTQKDLLDKCIIGIILPQSNNRILFVSKNQPNIGDIIISQSGVIGRVDKIFDNYSQVISLKHKNFKIRAFSMNSNTEGVVFGNGCKTFFSPKIDTDEVKDGEILFCYVNSYIYVIGTINGAKIKSIDGKFIYNICISQIKSSVGLIVKRVT